MYRGLNEEMPRQNSDQDPVWSYFDQYKISGSGYSITRPELSSFSHQSPEKIELDVSLVANRRGRPHLREQRLSGPDAFAFENFLTYHALHDNWFGGELSVTTNYDDWIGGVDAVVEWPNNDGEVPVRMAIDFTATDQFDTFYKKTDKLEGNALVKYYRSKLEEENGQPKEMRLSLPIVLLGVDESVFRAIAEQNEPIDHHHPLRRLLLEQSAYQVDLQIDLVEELINGRRRRNGKSFDQILNTRISPKIRIRYAYLLRLQVVIHRELLNAQAEIHGPIFDKFAQSKTHRILSNS